MRYGIFRRRVITALAATLAPLVQAGPLEFSNRTLGFVSSPTLTADCFYFTLQGVAQADPGAPNQPWFAVPRTHQGFKEIAMLVAMAKASDRTVTVRTGTTFSCGYITVEYVYVN